MEKELEDFVTEVKGYEIICCLCINKTEVQRSVEDAVKRAEILGYEVYPDGIYCGACIEEVEPD